MSYFIICCRLSVLVRVWHILIQTELIIMEHNTMDQNQAICWLPNSYVLVKQMLLGMPFI